MATIGSLNVILSASTAAFAQGMAGAAHAVESFSHAVAEHSRSAAIDLAKMTTGLNFSSLSSLVGSAIDGAIRLMEEGIQRIKQTGKTAISLGIDVEAFSKLQFAAEKSGVELDMLSSAVAKLEKNLAEAAITGQGSAVKALDRLGLSARELASGKPDEAFIQIADAIRKIENPSERAFVASELFGKGFRELMPLLLRGAEGMQKLAEEAEHVGKAVSSLDVAKIKVAGQAWKELKEAAEGKAQESALQVLIGIETLRRAVQLRSWGKAVDELQEKLAEAKAKIDELTAAGGGEELSEQFDKQAESVQKVIDNLQLELEMVGKSAALRTVRTLQDMGASDDEVLKAYRIASAIQAKQEKLNRDKSVEATVSRLGDQVFMFGLSAEAADVLRIKMMGASEGSVILANAAAEAHDRLAELMNFQTSGNSVTELFNDWMVRITRLRDEWRKGVISDESLMAAERKLDKLFDKEIAERGRRAFEDSLTPIEKFQRQMEDLKKLRELGAIDLKTFGREAAKRQQEAIDASGFGQNVGGAAALQFGTREAYSATRPEGEDVKSLLAAMLAQQQMADQEFTSMRQILERAPLLALANL